MNMNERITRLEDRIGIKDEIPPMILIKIADQRRGSTDTGTAQMGIVPGKICGPQGAFLIRDESESSDAFLERCSTQYDKIYATY